MKHLVVYGLALQLLSLIPIFIIAIAVGLIVYYFLFNTSKGFQLRAVVFNMTAAKFNGFAVEKYFIFSFLISGMIAGLGGSAEILLSLIHI